MKERRHHSFRLELVIALAIALMLIGSIFSQEYFNLPYQWVSFFIAIFIIIKIVHIINRGGTIFEDYVSLAAMAIFGAVHYILAGKVSILIILLMIGILLYSIGLIVWLKELLSSRKVISFIMSYIIFVIFIVLLFAGAYSANGSNFSGIPDGRPMLSFEESFYFSTMTFTTVGYGDISPTGVNRTIASIEALTAIMFNTAFIGYLLASNRFKQEHTK